MIKVATVIAIFLASPCIYTMDQNESNYQSEDESDGFVFYVKNMDKDWKKLKHNPQWETFYCSLEETKLDNDTEKFMRMSKTIFKQLFVQASNNITLDPLPRQELLEKLKRGIIDIHSKGKVYMTTKDANHRLLSYIPASKSEWHHICLINDKKLTIQSRDFQTEEDIIDTKKRNLEIEAEDQASSEIQSIYYEGTFSGEEIKVVNYNFKKKDPSHYQLIVRQFNELMNK